MFILARKGGTYARLRFNVGPQTSQRLGIRVEYGAEFPGADHDGWLEEYDNTVQSRDPFASRVGWLAAEIAEPWTVPDEPENSVLASEWVAS